MNFKKLVRLQDGVTGVSGCFAAYGSFGEVDGADRDMKKITETKDGYQGIFEQFTVNCAFENLEYGVCRRRDTFINTSTLPLQLTHYVSRFCLEGGEYEVYTQYSSWQRESMGKWQELVTGVELSPLGMRTCDGASPMAAIRNKSNGKIFVFHLLPNMQWKIKISRVPSGGTCNVVTVELGMQSRGMAITCQPGESIAMPQIFAFEAKSAIDLDAWKMHAVFHRLYPRKRGLPIMYNTWLLDFDHIDVEDILRQAETSAELGVEYFVLDAGWFGSEPDWSSCIGDWVENQTGGFCGRVKEISQRVHALGMKFGMWLEPERALSKVSSVKEHPDYYIPGSGDSNFLDFSNPEALQFIFDITCGLIDAYQLDYMKFDFNAYVAYDPSCNAFYRYFQGQRKFIEMLRAKYPALYLTNCASGGARMEMEQTTLFDSTWISDNQGPYDGLRIFKDTALRLVPASIEKWDVRAFRDNFPAYQHDRVTLPISCNNATWDFVVSVKESYTYAFLTGGPIGFSCNLADFPAEEKRKLKEFLTQYKKDRAFYAGAVMRILHDDPRLLILQYSDLAGEKAIVQVFTKVNFQDSVTVYPVLAEEKLFAIGEQTKSGAEWKEEGFTVDGLGINSCRVFRLGF